MRRVSRGRMIMATAGPSSPDTPRRASGRSRRRGGDRRCARDATGRRGPFSYFYFSEFKIGANIAAQKVKEANAMNQLNVPIPPIIVVKVLITNTKNK